ncbi:MAG TPA: dihydrolipoamide acetyltransferase family protein [Gammaproteobacteria bacterium]|nr:dihydrolipoamide acetyltransferase family protein [Gammaproteobacteria bacterium]
MTIFKLPDLGEGLPDAEIREWYVSEGDEVKLDQPLVSMETAKAVVDVPSPHAGKIVKLYGKPGDVIQTGAPLIGFAETHNQQSTSSDSGTVVGVIETSDKVLQESPTGIDVKIPSRSSIKAIPAVRALANRLNIDLTTVIGTGAGGAITAEDVNQAASGTKTVLGEPLHGVRRIMALQMAKSHAEVVPATLVEDADIHNWPEKTDVSLRLIQALIKACQVEPNLNAHFYGQSVSRELCPEINIGIAVDTPTGLYVPVIKNAEQQTPEMLRTTLNSFKSKAAQQSFTPEDLQNPTITLSNFGTIAGRYASPIVMPPTVAIIAIGKTRQQVVPVNGELSIHNILPISLTFDHRAVTGGEAARFLATFIKDLE